MSADLRCRHGKEIGERAAVLFASERGSRSVARAPLDSWLISSRAHFCISQVQDIYSAVGVVEVLWETEVSGRLRACRIAATTAKTADERDNE